MFSSDDLLFLPPLLTLLGVDALSEELKALQSELGSKLESIGQQLQSMSQSVAQLLFLGSSSPYRYLGLVSLM